MLSKRFIDVHRLSPAIIARINSSLNQKLPSLYQRQHLHLATRRLKWISAEEAKRVAPVAVGAKSGHPDDPTVNTADSYYDGSPEKGDKCFESHYWYRAQHEIPSLYYDRLTVKLLTTLMWFWLFYHLYYDYGLLVGHFYTPYMEEFTDEELGILPDDAPDPEYWGNHSKPYGSYL